MQPSLFDTHDWRKEWVGMPEFVQERQREFSKIIVRFDSQEDLEDFSKLIGQKLTPKTKSIWHPAKSHWGRNGNLAWVNDK